MNTVIPTTASIVNKPRKVIRNAVIFTLLMIAGAVITGNSGLDGMNGGYALIVLFGFLAMSSLSRPLSICQGQGI